MRNRKEKLGLVVEESVNGGIVLWESAEEREARLARGRVRERAAQSTAQREALQRRRERLTRETSEESAVRNIPLV